LPSLYPYFAGLSIGRNLATNGGPLCRVRRHDTD
jgi:hypothetical protein